MIAELKLNKKYKYIFYNNQVVVIKKRNYQGNLKFFFEFE